MQRRRRYKRQDKGKRIDRLDLKKRYAMIKAGLLAAAAAKAHRAQLRISPKPARPPRDRATRKVFAPKKTRRIIKEAGTPRKRHHQRAGGLSAVKAASRAIKIAEIAVEKKTSSRTPTDTQKKVRRLAELLKLKFKEFKPVDGVVNMRTRPAMVARGIVTTSRLGGEACLVTRKRIVNGKPVIFATLQRMGDMKRPKTENAYSMIFANGRALGDGVYGIAYITRTALFIPSATKITTSPTKEPYEARYGLYIARAVVNNVCPNILCTLGYSVCVKAPPKGIKLPEGIKKMYDKRKRYVVINMELATGGTLNSMLKALENEGVPRMNLRTWASIVLQQLFGLRTMHSSRIAHCDNHVENVLYNAVSPGGCWHYRLDRDASGEPYGPKTCDVFVPNLGFQLLVTDFGLVRKWALNYAIRDLERVVALYEWRHHRRYIDEDVYQAVVKMDDQLRKIYRDSQRMSGDVPSTYPVDRVIFTVTMLLRERFGMDLFEKPDGGGPVFNKGEPYLCFMPVMETFIKAQKKKLKR